LNAKQKEREQQYVEQIREFVPDFPDGSLLPGETPDFRVDLGGEILGIEVTEVPNQRRRAVESEWDSILRDAETLAGRSLPHLDVAVSFDASHHIRKPDRGRIGKALVSAVAAHLPPHGEQTQIRNSWRGALPDAVRMIHVARYDRLTGHCWTPLDGGMVTTDCRSEIQNAVDRKQRRLPACLEKCRRCWLLIVASGNAPSSFLDPDVSTRLARFSSEFDRAFFLNAFSSRWFELCQ
jgi:hypothetical protein